MQGRASAYPHHAYLPRPRTSPNRIQKENAFTTRTRQNNPERIQVAQRPTPRADMQGRASVHPRHAYLPRPRASSNRQTDNTTTTHTNYHGHPQSTTDHLLPGKPQNNHQNNHQNNYHHQIHQRVGFARLYPSPVVKRGVDLDGDCQMTGMPFIYSKKDWFRIQREVRQLQIEEQQRITNDPDSSMTDAPNTVYRS
ncbi:hypothetical protein BJY01DRAFT_228891 [Aspergillus pseudoustus]|uniref:Uncharacterized protein n=1 Tax=Aspergillus pseudoustus TaxID=1810923 RepID=A0ABR4IJF4_9EURO